MSSTMANPYMPPSAFVADVSTADSESDAIRSEHIRHESSVRSIGLLYYLAGSLCLIAGPALLIASLAGKAGPEAGVLTFIGVLYSVFAALFLSVGRGLRQLRTWARTAGIVLSCIGLLGFPLGTLMHGYFLYLYFAEKGKRIFEPDYADIVAATPHIKPSTSAIVWLFVVLLAVMVIGIIAAVVIPMVSR
jgi:hypothetical protein